MRELINLTIHQEDPLLIEVMGVSDSRKYDPIESDLTNRIVIREIVLGNITIMIYEP